MDLLDTIRRLYDAEIACGVQTVLFIGADAWIGDPWNGHYSERHFEQDQLCDIPHWLDEEARRLFPGAFTASAST